MRKDVAAGLVNAVVNVPDGLASAALVGVNPVHGLYTGVVGPISGSLLVSSQLMLITTTSASALAAGQVISGYPEADRQITTLHVYGSLFFAGARKLEELLPDPEGAARPAVVIRLRGRRRLGATLIEVLENYSNELERARGRLFLAGLSDDAVGQLRRAGKLDLDRVVILVPADETLGASTEEAVAWARAWLQKHAMSDPPE